MAAFPLVLLPLSVLLPPSLDTRIPCKVCHTAIKRNGALQWNGKRGEKLFLHSPSTVLSLSLNKDCFPYFLLLCTLLIRFISTLDKDEPYGVASSLPRPDRDRIESRQCRLRKSAVKAFRGRNGKWKKSGFLEAPPLSF